VQGDPLDGLAAFWHNRVARLVRGTRARVWDQAEAARELRNRTYTLFLYSFFVESLVMLGFSVYIDGEPVADLDLCGAYLVGSDDVALRAEISFKKGRITCKKRAAGPAGLAILWPMAGGRRIMLETARLMERDQPYILQIELVRGRLTRISQKLEEWGFYESQEGDEFLRRFEQCRDLLIQALQADPPVQAAAVADRALPQCVALSEDLSRHHADVLLDRRRESSGFGRRVLGCAVDLEHTDEAYRKRLAGAFDYVTIPCTWRLVEPAEQKFNWKPIDAWVEWFAKKHIPMKGSPLLSFGERNVPDWLYIWEHDFETLRDLAHEHVKRVVSRYTQYVSSWDVASGLHAENGLSFTFEQLMELTRMSAAVAKQIAPRCTAIIDLIAPWGEYYARNPRTIPPMLYAEMIVQSGVNFDAFGLQFLFGLGVDGMYVRDMFQISALLDRFSGVGKPLHVTAVQAPSDVTPERDDAWGGEKDPRDGGAWNDDWSETVQAEWLQAFYEIALSKPFVESVSWSSLADGPGRIIPHGGLLRRDLVPKPAFDRILKLRSEGLGGS